MMKQIPLSQSKFALVDDEDYERVNQYKWCINSNGYAVTSYRDSNGKRKAMKMHRFILNLNKGDSLVDHRDTIRINNQKYNLRVASFVENLRNQKINKNNKSGFKGVRLHKPSSLYIAQIGINGKQKHIGYFKCPVEAAKAYNEAAIKYFGEFAQLNEIKY